MFDVEAFRQGVNGRPNFSPPGNGTFVMNLAASEDNFLEASTGIDFSVPALDGTINGLLTFNATIPDSAVASAFLSVPEARTCRRDIKC